jgi:hypothetical protein
VSFVQSLVEAKEGGQQILLDTLQKANVQSLDKLSKADVSTLITTLRTTADKQATITEVGAYLYEGVIYSVRRLYNSKKLIIYTYDVGSKKYLKNYPATKNVLNKLLPTHRLTLEEAEKYSAHTGICCHCGRTLTVLKSVAGGIGPICSKYYNKRNGVSSLL